LGGAGPVVRDGDDKIADPTAAIGEQEDLDSAEASRACGIAEQVGIVIPALCAAGKNNVDDGGADVIAADLDAVDVTDAEGLVTNITKIG
jgi:hypothetical protein